MYDIVDRNKFVQIIKSVVLDNADIYISLIQEGIGITAIDHTKDTVSKIGGSPDLPIGVAYPIGEDTIPYTFLAQLKLDEITIENDLLPKTGVLYFFYTITDDIKRNFKVIYSKENVELFPFDYNELTHKPIPFKERSITYYKRFFLPSISSVEGYKALQEHKYGYNEEVEDILDAYADILSEEHSSGNHLLGIPEELQNDIYLQWTYENTSFKGNYLDIEEKYIEESKEYVNLFQFNLEIDFDTLKQGEYLAGGAGGRVYFGIKKDDLVKQQFDNVRCVYEL